MQTTRSASQPTRGVDVGSIEFIHSQIVKARDGGAGVLLISAELDEVMGLSDRILVMYDGRVVAELDGDGADRNRIGRLMAGGEDTHPSSTYSAWARTSLPSTSSSPSAMTGSSPRLPATSRSGPPARITSRWARRPACSAVCA